MRYIPLIILIAALSSCKPSPAEQGNASKYFEGFVEFGNSYEGADTSFVSSLKKLHGASTKTYLGADGSFAREAIDSNSIIISREIFRPDSARTYYCKAASDTVISSAVNYRTKSAIVSVQKQSAFKILNHVVDIVNTKRYIYSRITGQNYYVYATYYNDINYPINPLTYKNYYRNSVEEIFARSPYISTGYKIVHGDRGIYISLAKNIVRTHIDAWHFEIPKNKIIVDK